MDATPITTPDPTTQALLATRPTLKMDAHDGLCLEGVPLTAIAEQAGTPCWITGLDTLRHRAQTLKNAFATAGLTPSIHFAMKANDQQITLQTLGELRLGVDVVSGGELRRARHAGIPAAHIVFSGVGKTDAELDLALTESIAQINVESAEELTRLSNRAQTLGRPINVVLRVNPDVDAATHEKISTGRAGDKFGIALSAIPELYAHAATLPGITPIGLAVHIGSQIQSPAPFRIAYAKIATLVQTLRAQGQTVKTVDCGGGIGIRYRDEIPLPPEAWAATIREAFGTLDLHLAIEPGRWLTAESGLLLSRVIDRKAGFGGEADIIILDAAMNDLARPSLYDSWHGIVPLAAHHAHAPTESQGVVGPICESSDQFSTGRMLPRLHPNDLVAFLDTGAYGAVMSSTYNSRPLLAQVAVDQGRWAITRPAQPIDALWAQETQPDWT